MQELIGKYIKNIYRSSDERMIRFDLLEGCLLYYAYSECHTETWFKDIDISVYKKINPSLIDNFHEVESIEKIDDYGYKIYCFGISITIVAIHSSSVSGDSNDLNYGGEIRLPEWDNIIEYTNDVFIEWINIPKEIKNIYTNPLKPTKGI